MASRDGCLSPSSTSIPTIDSVRLGVVRPSMKKNELLQKPEIEKPKNRCKDLPGKGYIYGITTHKSGGVAEALNGWATKATLYRTSSHPHRKNVIKDFVNMNRTAVSLGLSSTKDNSLFRQSHPMTRPDRPPEEQRRKTQRSEFPPDMTFGQRTPLRPSMFDILQQKFRREYIENQWVNTAKDGTLYERERMVIGKMILTKSTKQKLMDAAAAAAAAGDTSTNKYPKVGPALQSFRSKEERDRSLAYVNALKEEKQRMVEDHQKAIALCLALRASMSHPQKMDDIRRSRITPKVYSQYSCNPFTGERRCDPGQICVTKRWDPSTERRRMPPWKTISA